MRVPPSVGQSPRLQSLRNNKHAKRSSSMERNPGKNAQPNAQLPFEDVMIPDVLYKPRPCSCLDETDEGAVLAEEFISANIGIKLAIGKLQAWACRTGCSEVSLGESGKVIIIPGNKTRVFDPGQLCEVFILQYGMARTDAECVVGNMLDTLRCGKVLHVRRHGEVYG